jgi:hypothetical protein
MSKNDQSYLTQSGYGVFIPKPTRLFSRRKTRAALLRERRNKVVAARKVLAEVNEYLREAEVRPTNLMKLEDELWSFVHQKHAGIGNANTSKWSRMERFFERFEKTGQKLRLEAWTKDQMEGDDA